MAIPTFDETFYPCLKFLSDGQPHHVSELYSYIEKYFSLSEAEINMLLPSKTQKTYQNRVGWSLSYLFKAKFVERKSKGVYQITPLGTITFNSGSIDSKKIIIIANTGTETDCNKQKHKPEAVVSTDVTPDEEIERLHNIISSKLADELLERVYAQTPKFFEKMVVNLLDRMGYGGYDNTVTPIGHDGGIDGIINEDKLGFGKIYIQAKKWNPTQTVSKTEIQKFAGALHENNATKGLFITTAKFSDGAFESAKKSNIILVDGERLAKLMIEYNFGVFIECSYEIKKIDSDFFENNE